MDSLRLPAYLNADLGGTLALKHLPDRRRRGYCGVIAVMVNKVETFAHSTT